MLKQKKTTNITKSAKNWSTRKLFSLLRAMFKGNMISSSLKRTPFAMFWMIFETATRVFFAGVDTLSVWMNCSGLMRIGTKNLRKMKEAIAFRSAFGKKFLTFWVTIRQRYRISGGHSDMFVKASTNSFVSFAMVWASSGFLGYFWIKNINLWKIYWGGRARIAYIKLNCVVRYDWLDQGGQGFL